MAQDYPPTAASSKAHCHPFAEPRTWRATVENIFGFRHVILKRICVRLAPPVGDLSPPLDREEHPLSFLSLSLEEKNKGWGRGESVYVCKLWLWEPGTLLNDNSWLSFYLQAQIIQTLFPIPTLILDGGRGCYEPPWIPSIRLLGTLHMFVPSSTNKRGRDYDKEDGGRRVQPELFIWVIVERTIARKISECFPRIEST